MGYWNCVLQARTMAIIPGLVNGRTDADVL